jgi:hypothetical protein
METRSSENSVSLWPIARRHDKEYRNHHTHNSENLKSKITSETTQLYKDDEPTASNICFSNLQLKIEHGEKGESVGAKDRHLTVKSWVQSPALEEIFLNSFGFSLLNIIPPLFHIHL